MPDLQLYKHLPPRHIRVLDIAGDTGNDPLRGKLRIVSLDSYPEFAALSYVWGAPAAVPFTIFCDSIKVDITPNCHAALWHLREKLGTHTIWVDAICINQKDDEEKAGQIPLMGDIYAKAQHAYIWLGVSTPWSDRVIRYLTSAGLQGYVMSGQQSGLLERFFSCASELINPAYMWLYHNKSRHKPSAPQSGSTYEALLAAWSLVFAWASLGVHPFPFDGWLSTKLQKPWSAGKCYVHAWELLAFLNQEWLSRVWTYQEIMLARHPIMVCGTSHLPWLDFSKALLFLSSTRNEQLSMSIDSWESLAFDRERLIRTDLQAHETFVRKVFSTYTLIQTVGAHVLLYIGIALSAVGIWFSTKDVRRTGGVLVGLGILIASCGIVLFSTLYLFWQRSDVVKLSVEVLPWAIRNRVAREPKDKAYGVWAILQQRGAQLPKPSYTRTLQDVYKDLTGHVLRATNSMDVLILASIQGMPSCPSWVPDWASTTIWPSNMQAVAEVAPTRNFLFGFIPIDRSLRMQDIISEEQRSAIWSLTDVLTVQAHDIGSLTHRVTFQRTSEAYFEEEKQLHLDNLASLHECVSWLSDRSLSPFLGLLGINISVTRKRVWYRQLQDRVAWDALPAWAREQQIKICNLLAQSERSAWKAELGGRSCVIISLRVSVGDRILRVKGMLQPFVVRHFGQGNMVKIAGPFAQHQGNWYTTIQGYRPKSVVFEEYHIH